MMRRKNNILKIFIILLLVGWWQHYSYAQVNKLLEAFDCYQNRDFNCAKSKVDEVVLHPETKDEPVAWSLKAHVYYQFFKNYEYNVYNSNYRNEALNAVQMSQSLAPDAETETNNKRLIKAIAESYFNQIKIFLYDSMNYERCLELYSNYKNIYKQVEPAMDFKSKDVEFYLSVGGQFVTTVKKLLDLESNIPQSLFDKYTEISKVAFNKVIELDPNHPGALKGLAVAYYNQGAKLIKEMSFDTPIEQIEQIQENANKYFKQALPYMQKANEVKPNDPDIIEGLTGIYYALHENEKYIEYKKKLDSLKKQSEPK
ncbi:MAG: hypothetical protein KatS3mg027_2376 [Bacteroidia bacterium]|nr:MAG: hypothetical protein KatS3mg027_2376 [Bacteroidia bacterium]